MISNQETKKKTLYEYLKENNISVEQCSKEANITIPTIYHIWKGNNKPNYDNGEKIKNYTNSLVTW